jgi:hypothetical protein
VGRRPGRERGIPSSKANPGFWQKQEPISGRVLFHENFR